MLTESHFSQDWFPVIINENVLPWSSLGKVLADFTANTCRIAAGLSYTIYYSEMGYTANPQKYIIKIEKQVEQIVWIYNKKNTSQPQTFPVEVSFQFVKITSQEA